MPLTPIIIMTKCHLVEDDEWLSKPTFCCHPLFSQATTAGSWETQSDVIMITTNSSVIKPCCNSNTLLASSRNNVYFLWDQLHGVCRIGNGLFWAHSELRPLWLSTRMVVSLTAIRGGRWNSCFWPRKWMCVHEGGNAASVYSCYYPIKLI